MPIKRGKLVLNHVACVWRMRFILLVLVVFLRLSMAEAWGAWQGGFVVTGRVSLPGGRPASRVMVKIEGLDTPVSPGSTLGGVLLVNAIKAELADRLTKAGRPPTVLTAAATVGPERAAALFESAYDEHARRLAMLYKDLGT